MSKPHTTIDVVQVMRNWLELNQAQLTELGVTSLLSLGSSQRTPRSAWIDFETSQFIGRVIGWERGDVEVELANAQTGEIVVMIDLAMPGVDGVEAIRRIAERERGARIVVLTSFATHEHVLPAIKAGALEYLLKGSGPEELVRAIYQAHRVNRRCTPSSRAKCWPNSIDPRHATSRGRPSRSPSASWAC